MKMENNSDVLLDWAVKNIPISDVIGYTAIPYGRSNIVLANVVGQRPRFIGQFFVDDVELKNCPVYTLAGKEGDYFIYITKDSLLPAVDIKPNRMLTAMERLAIKRAFDGHIGVDSLMRENEYLRGILSDANKSIENYCADKILGA